MKCETEDSLTGGLKKSTVKYSAGFVRDIAGDIRLESADENYFRVRKSNMSGGVYSDSKGIRRQLDLYFEVEGKFSYFEIIQYEGRETLWRVSGYSDMHRLRLNGELVCELKDCCMVSRCITDNILGIGVAVSGGKSNDFFWANYKLNRMIESGELTLSDVKKTFVYKNAEKCMSVCCDETFIEDKEGVCHGYIVECVPIVRRGKTEYMYVILNRYERAHTVRSELFARLTPRETEIVELVSKGLTNKYIAGSLGISEGTVKKSLHNSYRKLNVCSRFDIMKLFGQGG